MFIFSLSAQWFILHLAQGTEKISTRVVWGKMRMVSAKKHLITLGHQFFCFSYYSGKIKCESYHHGSLVFGIQLKVASELLCPTILILPLSPYPIQFCGNLRIIVNVSLSKWCHGPNDCI